MKSGNIASKPCLVCGRDLYRLWKSKRVGSICRRCYEKQKQSGSIMFECRSRCMICGRQTPHEVCHRHSLAINGDRYWPSSANFSRNHQRMYFRNFDREPEECSDLICLQRLEEEKE